ncbi:hypothetical protein H112_06912 [Trichophyton rubrum D6]|uniref:Uncharacterized protein n=2 Tax=Trichophyton TaxID=5550 RepID=A0A022VUY0_TRIRU|nr:hypothetical protein H100_06935 [Trichophyton rubrum MR850]EZF38939.1 hypothetical protein H102_06897 [Trichophyton rubrum CBS 100081]EZF49538.1 hypothetical protein H103_06920 [Trichophyton rubrum CBS 288.86]EZF60165.1 hypothetical protein H104_06875 [Trichophyton rubrum CBS 289.86]EZF70796.1 hypothetical protein H105_06935 [Trichophyton soudanense CBS 452.61]EZF81497.1 hypothetical protein H110_06916 [Trichophyton rubrum MR1448]EZF92184.1 hypothetical protein H113_06970 [Trichophyton rub
MTTWWTIILRHKHYFQLRVTSQYRIKRGSTNSMSDQPHRLVQLDAERDGLLSVIVSRPGPSCGCRMMLASVSISHTI